MTACSRATSDGEPLVLDNVSGTLASGATTADRRPRSGRRRSRCPTAAARCRCSSCSPSAISIRDYAPEAVAETLRHSRPRRSGASPPSWRMPPSSEEIELDDAVDRLGRAAPRDDASAGRSSMHAMRGISAHSNGFQTCRALHLLQILLGTIDVPGRLPLQVAAIRSPRRRPEARRQARARSRPASRCPGAPLGFPPGPRICCVDADGRPLRIDKAFSWDAPLAAHGLMHMVIANAGGGDPYPIDMLFMFMANMGWNSAMNTAETMRMLTDKDEATGEYRIPHIIYSDAYSSEMVAYADLVLPDTTYLERWDCISLLDRPISERRRPGRCDPPAGGRARPRRAAVPGRADRSRRPARPARLRHRRRRAALSRRLCRLHRQPRAHARASARSPAGAAPTARSTARARRTRTSSSATSPTAASGSTSCREDSATSSTPTSAYLDWARRRWA